AAVETENFKSEKELPQLKDQWAGNADLAKKSLDKDRTKEALENPGSKGAEVETDVREDSSSFDATRVKFKLELPHEVSGERSFNERNDRQTTSAGMSLKELQKNKKKKKRPQIKKKAIDYNDPELADLLARYDKLRA